MSFSPKEVTEMVLSLLDSMMPASLSQTFRASYWRFPKTPWPKQLTPSAIKCSTHGCLNPKCWYAFMPFIFILLPPPVVLSDFAARQLFSQNVRQLEQWQQRFCRIKICPLDWMVNAPVGHWTSQALHPWQYATLLAMPLRWLIVNLSILENGLYVTHNWPSPFLRR